MWQHENSVEVDIFVEKVESEATALEGKFLEHISRKSDAAVDYGKLISTVCVTLV